MSVLEHASYDYILVQSCPSHLELVGELHTRSRRGQTAGAGPLDLGLMKSAPGEALALARCSALSLSLGLSRSLSLSLPSSSLAPHSAIDAA